MISAVDKILLANPETLQDWDILKQISRTPGLLEEETMSLPPTSAEVIPANIVGVARDAFPKGTPAMRIRDFLGTLYTDDQL